MPRSKLKVLGKPEYTNVVIAAHAICVRTTMPPLVFVENFLGFQLQDKHNASILFQMSLDRIFHPIAKVRNLFDRRIIFNVISAKLNAKVWRPSAESRHNFNIYRQKNQSSNKISII